MLQAIFPRFWSIRNINKNSRKSKIGKISTTTELTRIVAYRLLSLKIIETETHIVHRSFCCLSDDVNKQSGNERVNALYPLKKYLLQFRSLIFSNILGSSRTKNKSEIVKFGVLEFQTQKLFKVGSSLLSILWSGIQPSSSTFQSSVRCKPWPRKSLHKVLLKSNLIPR